MGKVIEYDIKIGSTAAKLVAKVQEVVPNEDGQLWELLGAPFVEGGMWYQAMVRFELPIEVDDQSEEEKFFGRSRR